MSPGIYVGLGDLHFLADVRTEGRPLHAALLHRSGVLVPASALARRHRRDAVPRRARGAGAHRPDAPAGGEHRVCDSAGAGRRRSVSGAAADARGAAIAGRLSDAGVAAQGAGDRAAVLGDQHRVPPPRRVHAGVDRALAAARQRLQRSHSAGLSRSRARRWQISEPRVVRHARTARRALRGVPPRSDGAERSRRSRSGGWTSNTSVTCGRSRRTATCGSTKSSAGRASLLRRPWRCCTRGRSPATRRTWRVSTITTPSSIPGSWRGSRTSCRAIR